MTVYKPAASRFYHYDFQFKRKRYHGSTGVETLRKAEEVERQIREKAALGIDPNGGLSLDEAAGKWWDEVGQHRAGSQHIERRLGIMLRLLGADTLLVDVGTKEISRGIEKRRKETFTRAPDRPAQDGRPAVRAKRYPVSNATVNADIIGVLRPIMNRAADVWEVKGLKAIDWKRLRLEEPQELVQFYTPAQEAGWLGECDASSRLPLEILLTYGLRYGELFFHPRQFDAVGPKGAPVLRVNRRRKKGGNHTVLLTEAHARQIAARVGIAMAASLETIWFERGPRGKLVAISYLGLQARLRSAARRAGLGDLPRVIHGTRHHVGTDILRRTGNLRLAKEVLGHQDIKSTMRYAHVLEDELRRLHEEKSRNSPGAGAAEVEFVVPEQRRKRRQASPS